MNTIELITKYSTKAWDEVYKAESISSLLDAPSAQVQFTGAKTAKIAKFQAGGLGDYYRNNTETNSGTNIGYQGAELGLVWEEYTLKCDRAAKYSIEKFDDEETDGLTLGAATTEISRTILIPEVDAYCFSTIAGNAGKTITVDSTALVGADAGKKKSIEYLNEGFLHLEEHEILTDDQIVLVSPKYMQALRRDSLELSRLLQSDFNKDVKFTMTKYEGRDLVVVPPQRFKTKIKLTKSGYTFDTGSQDIAFMIFPKSAVTHVVKYNKVKVIGGDMNLAGNNFDGYSIYVRIYHDVFVMDNKKVAIVAGLEDKYIAKGLEVTADSAKKVTALSFRNNAEKVKFGQVSAATAPTAVPSSITELKVGDTLTAATSTNGTYVYAYVVKGTDKVLLDVLEVYAKTSG